MKESAFSKYVNELRSDDIAIIQDAANTLCALKDMKNLPSILKNIDDDNPIVRRVMLWTLRNYINNLDFDNLIKYLMDEDMGVRDAALVLLMDGGKPAIDKMLTYALSEDRAIQYAVVQALGQFRTPDAVGPLVQASQSEDDEIREIAVMSLGIYADPVIRQILLKSLNDKPDICLAALSGLKDRILLTDDYKLIEKCLKNDRDDIRAAAVYVLNSSCPLNISNDVSSYVRRAFASVTNSKSHLEKLCIDPEPSVRTAAADRIEKLKLKSEDILIKMLEDDVPGVRRAAASALKYSERKDVISALIKCLSDKKPGIRAAAAASLANIGGDDAISALKSAKSAGNPILAGIIKNAIETAQNNSG